MSGNKVRLAALDRALYLQEMEESGLDLLVIGGGITGAGIALDAAVRGLRIGLVEKQDFAEGTSSRSTKLIHGGLRYLKQGEIRLVREVGRERAILHRNAPHLVSPEKMMLPIVDGGTYGRLATSIGLWLYDQLAGVQRSERRVMLSREAALQAEPLLNPVGLRGAGLYYEYRTDDARLTIEVLKTATAYGARCVNYAEVVDFLYDAGRVAGAQVQDRLGGGTYRIRAKKVVNATGPWVDDLRQRDGPLRGRRLHLTKGVHLVVPHRRFPLQQAVYFDVPDGRMVFAIPRGECTYIGTTDTDYHGTLEQPRTTIQDAEYLLSAANHMFPSVKLAFGDVDACWAGLRPLVHQDGKPPSELSRRDEIFVSASGLVSIAGGKLTGYRKMAERTVDLVAVQLAQEGGPVFQTCRTDQIPLSGGGDVSGRMREGWLQQLQAAGLSRDAAETAVIDLVGKYGSNTSAVMAHVARLVAAEVPSEEALVLGEFHYCVQDEMATSPSDFLVRRTGRLLFARRAVGKWIEPLHAEAARLFGWTAAEAAAARRRWEAEYRLATEFATADWDGGGGEGGGGGQ